MQRETLKTNYLFNMETKKCFKCGIIKPLSEFYKHPKMEDGNLNKCKECTKKESKARYNVLSKDKNWLEKERQRSRDKFKRLGYKDKFKKVREICPLEANIAKKLRNRGYDTKGKEAHHWNYNLPYSIFLLSRKAHRCIHQFINVNYSDKYCYTKDGEKIDTVEKAISIFSSALSSKGIHEELKILNISP